MNKIILALLSIPRSVWFNFRYLPLKDAMKLPILLAPNVRVKNMWRGGMKLDDIHFGSLHIGFHEADAVDTYSCHTVIDIRKNGTMECYDVHIGHGAIICIKGNGNLNLGKNFAISGTTKIICSDRIEIGDNVQFSWDSLVMDSDAHYVLNIDGKQLQNTAPIRIGNHVWVAANTTILKGATIGNNCVVAGNSLLNKKYDLDNHLIAGIPAKVIKPIGGWQL